MRKMKLITFFISLIAMPFILSSCAEIRAETCNPNAAYSSGFNDAMTGSQMQTDYASICQTNIAAINKAYRRGYKYGLRQKRRQKHHRRYY